MSSFIQKFEKLGYTAPPLVPLAVPTTASPIIASLARSGTSPPPSSPTLSLSESYGLDAIDLNGKLLPLATSEGAEASRAPLLSSEDWSGWGPEAVDSGFSILPRTRAMRNLAALGKEAEVAVIDVYRKYQYSGTIATSPSSTSISRSATSLCPVLEQSSPSSDTSSDECGNDSQAGKLPVLVSRRRRVAKFTT